MEEIKTKDVIIIVVGTIIGGLIAAFAIEILTDCTCVEAFGISSAGSLAAISARFISISKTHNITPKKIKNRL
ncbi:MAG: hypothetical protein LBK58_08140 [Prevotellaceae bacterium]|jgi:hypothetical protein|nr:hypothetical protein [Prevotellaceae bacterium]